MQEPSGTYQFLSAAQLVKIDKTFKRLQSGEAQSAHVSETLGQKQVEEGKADKLSADDIIRRFSDKRIKKPPKVKSEQSSTQKKQTARSGVHSAKMFRYYIPLLFLSGESKTIIRRCKVLNMKEDKRYDSLSKYAWEAQYGSMLPYKIEQQDKDVQPVLALNNKFDVEQFTLCGGVTNSKFWDINLRYAETACSMCDDDEVHAFVITHLTKFLLNHLDKSVTGIPKSAAEQQQKKE